MKECPGWCYQKFGKRFHNLKNYSMGGDSELRYSG
jgi:hypothetical protein